MHRKFTMNIRRCSIKFKRKRNTCNKNFFQTFNTKLNIFVLNKAYLNAIYSKMEHHTLELIVNYYRIINVYKKDMFNNKNILLV